MLNQAIFKPYGTITDLKLDTARHSIEATVDLKGESEPVQIHIHEYEIIEENGTPFVILKEISTSREWLTALAQHQAVGRRFEIPHAARSYLSMLK